MGRDAIWVEDTRATRGAKQWEHTLADPGRRSLDGGGLTFSWRLRERWSVVGRRKAGSRALGGFGKEGTAL